MRLPLTIDSGMHRSGHCQGLQVNLKKREIYFSFTTAFVRMSLDGKPIGSVEGLRGHLGCLALNPENGLVYASLEYKSDAIGKGILKMLGEDTSFETAFYAAAFDPEKITRMHMTPEDDGVMKSVFLKKPLEDHLCTFPDGRKHRYGCSGIDGMSFGPMFGCAPGSENHLFITYGIYRDNERKDNDHQVLLGYKAASLPAYLKPMNEEAMHRSGPDAPDEILFAYTGNTTYGVQNLEYDREHDQWLMAVYPGTKPEFPNYPMFALDACRAPECVPLSGLGETGKRLFLKDNGLLHDMTGIRGFDFPFGTTGMCALGNGLFYISIDQHSPGEWKTVATLYKYDKKRLLVPADETDAEYPGL